MIRFGEQLAPTVGTLVDRFVDFVSWLTASEKRIDMVAGVLAGVFVAGVALAVAALWTFVPAVTAATGGLNLIIPAVALMVGGIVTWRKEIVSFLSGAWNWLKDAVSTANSWLNPLAILFSRNTAAAAELSDELAGHSLTTALDAASLSMDRFTRGSINSQNSLMGFLRTLQPGPPLAIEAAMATRALNLEFDRFPGGATQSQNALMGFIGALQILPGIAEPAGRAATTGFLHGMSTTFANAFAGGGGFLGGLQSVMTQGWSKLFLKEGEEQAGGFLGTMQGMFSKLGGVPLVGPLLAAFGPALIAGLGKLAGKAWTVIKGMFGGPDGIEKEGRRAARDAEREIGALIQVTDEMIGRDAKAKIHIAIRNAQIAAGHSAEIAEKMGADWVRALWLAEKEGGAAVNSIRDKILDLIKPQQDVVDGAADVTAAFISSDQAIKDNHARTMAQMEAATKANVAAQISDYGQLAGAAVGGAQEIATAFISSDQAIKDNHARTMAQMEAATKASVAAQISYYGQLAGAAVGGGTVGGESSYNKHAAGFGHLSDEEDFLRRNPGDEHRVDEALASRAFGGPVSAGQPYVVGERGPEMFVPGRSGSVVSNQQSMRPVVIRNQITIPIDDIAEEVIRRTADTEARIGFDG